ncbi:protein ABHD12B [Tachyglossus aculeatus]|uniref:protein ABHD12B n=1 Tax=Tachyglossus aculeatus TaxID=9261 RepID=UPI0018F40A6C|nr:protein ABHD12B [Tachyglossus aculeatus]
MNEKQLFQSRDAVKQYQGLLACKMSMLLWHYFLALHVSSLHVELMYFHGVQYSFLSHLNMRSMNPKRLSEFSSSGTKITWTGVGLVVEKMSFPSLSSPSKRELKWRDRCRILSPTLNPLGPQSMVVWGLPELDAGDHPSLRLFPATLQVLQGHQTLENKPPLKSLLDHWPPFRGPGALGGNESSSLAQGRAETPVCRSFSCSVPKLRRKFVKLYDTVMKSLKDHFFPSLMEKLVFFNFWNAPFLANLKNPESRIPHTVNFYVRPEPGVTLGVWHTVPESRGEEARGKDLRWYEAALRDGNPIIVYLHGSAENRASSHRVKLMKVLSEGGFHVLAVDYRGFGDSTGNPTEEGLTTDAVYLYDWAKAHSETTPVCLWGHSLGTGVATNAGKRLEESGRPAAAIILEAPFTNMRDAIVSHPMLKMYHNLPGFLHLFLDALNKDKIVFPNDENVKVLSSPLLILQGEDDNIVPLEQGKRLYDIAHNAYRNKERVKIVIFPRGFQHNLLCNSPSLPWIVRDFLSEQWK